ncbi:hypothetical protein FQN50_003918 [Emmonsiellopsis sp. PD_5]|nr:hypothetical protein FQN50_003918 [Emmonsiellopsis sp. PD_5]
MHFTYILPILSGIAAVVLAAPFPDNRAPVPEIPPEAGAGESVNERFDYRKYDDHDKRIDPMEANKEQKADDKNDRFGYYSYDDDDDDDDRKIPSKDSPETRSLPEKNPLYPYPEGSKQLENRQDDGFRYSDYDEKKKQLGKRQRFEYGDFGYGDYD